MTSIHDQHIGLYIHIPYCQKKCAYCDFSSIPVPHRSAFDDYVKALQTEIYLQASRFSPYTIETIYLGGGTPSLLAASQLESIIGFIKSNFRIREEAEVTLEVNPATVSRDKLQGFYEAGINRISLGVQSFFDADLRVLGRIHEVKDALSAIEDLHFLNILNFNIDLIYGIPGQSIGRWEKNLERVVQLQPAHISTYLLQLDPTTPLYREIANGVLTEPDEELEETMYRAACGYLDEHGYRQYEISNFGRPGLQCQHNLGYWEGRPYLGLGSAAVSLLDGERWINPWPLTGYLNPLMQGELPRVKQLEKMNQKDILAEAMIMGLRLVDGVRLNDIKLRCGLDPKEEYEELINKLLERGWLLWKKEKLCLNPDCYFVSNQILCQFLT